MRASLIGLKTLIKNFEEPITSSRILLIRLCCFNSPKAESLSYVTSSIQKEKIERVILLILNILASTKLKALSF